MRRLAQILRTLQELQRSEIPFGLGIGVVAAVVANTVLSRKIKFTPDGYNHAVRMLMATGRSYEAALKNATDFYRTQPVASEARYAHLFSGLVPPEHWDLFAPRVLYPHAAAALFRFRGFEALTDVTRMSYIGTGIATYTLLLNFSRPWVAAAMTLGVMFAPRVRNLSTTDMTHTSGLFLWTVTLDAMCRSLKCGTASQFVYAFSCFALTFTRPVPYLPFAAAACALCVGVVKGDRAKKKTSAAMMAVATLAGLTLGFVAAQLKAPGVRRLIREAHARALKARQAERYEALGFFRRLLAAIRNDGGPADQPIERWYVRAVGLSFANALAHAILGVAPIVAAVGVAKKRDDPCVPLLMGGVIGSIAGILGDPVPMAMAQTILLPLYPVVASGCGLAANFLIDILLSREGR